MHLTGDHKIYLEGRYGELLKIDSVVTAAFCKQQHMEKVMLVRQTEVRMCFQVGRKPADEDVLRLKLRYCAYIIDWKVLLHNIWQGRFIPGSVGTALNIAKQQHSARFCRLYGRDGCMFGRRKAGAGVLAAKAA